MSPNIRLRYLTRRIHALGERPLFELFRKLDDGELLAETLEQYARISYFTDFIAALDGRDLPPLISPGGEAMTSRILGLDPGAHGAIALLDEGGQLLEVHDMPSTPEANGRSATSAPLLAAIIAKSHARIAYCEFVSARPTDAKVAAFAFGRARGVIEGVCGALSLPIVFLTPPVWKGWPTSRPAPNTKTSPARAPLPDGRLMLSCSSTKPTSTGPRRR